MTGNDLISQSLRLIGKLAEGETMTAQAAQDARAYLNEIIDHWQTDHIRVFAKIQNTVNLTAAKQSYTIGSGGDFDIVRPVRINRAVVIPDSNAAEPIEIPVNVLTPQRWAAIRQKNTTSSYPYSLFYNKTMDANSRGTVFVYPIPLNTSAQFILWTEEQLNRFTDLTTNFTFPPAYARALREHLAIALAPEYGVQPLQTLMQSADESLDAIERTNSDDEVMVVDPGMLQGRGGYNVYTDEG